VKDKRTVQSKFRKITTEEFGTITIKRRQPDVESLVAEAKNLKVREAIVVDGWPLKTRPVHSLRQYIGDRQWSERKLPEDGSYAILRKK
jgi:hypothetical protein